MAAKGVEMKRRIHSPNCHQGSVLIEALIALLIFSLGILTMISLQAATVELSSDAKYRSDASLLANELIGQMWINDRTPATLQTNFQTNGPLYASWVNDVAATLPGVAGVAANQPTVTVTTVNPPAGASSTSNLVTIRLFWKSPNEAGSNSPLCGVTNPSAAHCYIVMAQIV